MHIINKILVLFISVVFLFSTTGIMLIHHVCDSCQVSEILINKQHTHKEVQPIEKSCCSGMSCNIDVKQAEDKSECCSEDPFYFKITEPFVPGTYNYDFEVQLIHLADVNFHSAFDNELSNQFYNTSIIKPPDLSGRDILRNNCILRI